MKMNKPPDAPVLPTFEEQVALVAAELRNDLDTGGPGARVLMVSRDDYGQPRFGMKRSPFVAELVGIAGGAPGAPSFIDQIDDKLDAVARGVELWEGKGDITVQLVITHAHGELVVCTGGKIKANAPQPPLQPRTRRVHDGQLGPDRQQELPHVRSDNVVVLPPKAGKTS